MILKLQNDQSFCLERKILLEHLRSVRDELADKSRKQGATSTSLLFALSLCELLSNWQLSLSILRAYDQVKGRLQGGQGCFHKFVQVLKDSNE